MRIAIIGVKALPMGASGIAREVEELGSRLAERGHEITVYVRKHYYEKGAEIPRTYKGMNIIALPSLRFKHLDTLSSSFLATLHALWKGYDVVHLIFTPLAWLAPVLGLRRAKTVVSIQGFEWERPKWGKLGSLFLRLSEWATVRLPNATVAVSRTLYDYTMAKFKGDVYCVPDGVLSIDPVEPSELASVGLESKKYFLYMGRLDEAKGGHLLIQAFLGLKTDKKLAFAGEGKFSEGYVGKLHDLAKDDPRICFLGPVTGRLWQELYTNAYLYVHPSESEGLSQALLEGMSAGNCCVVSDLEANLEAIGDHGVVFPSGDWLALQIKLAELLEDEQRVQDVGAAAKERVRSIFSWDKAADQMEAIYQGLANGDPLPPTED